MPERGYYHRSELSSVIERYLRDRRCHNRSPLLSVGLASVATIPTGHMRCNIPKSCALSQWPSLTRRGATVTLVMHGHSHEEERTMRYDGTRATLRARFTYADTHLEIHDHLTDRREEISIPEV